MIADTEEFGYNGDGSAQDVVRWGLETYHPDIALACSFQDTVLVHMMVSVRPDARVFAIDTGRLPEETFACAEAIRERFGIPIEWYFPRHEAVERLERERGLFSFRKSLDDRHECCAIRKVEPLVRALAGRKAWVTGSRRTDGVTRGNLQNIERDHAHGGILKLNPLADWSDEQVWGYIRKHDLPYNRLLDRGYASVGCGCCSRPIQPGESPRAGRWWWEEEEHKECGLHVRNWNV